MTDKATDVTVTQADREAAADYIDGELAYRSSRGRIIRDGNCDEDSTVQAFAAHRRTAQAELVSALDNLLDLYTRWRRQFGATQGDIDSEAYVHDARATLSKYRTDATKGADIGG